eukprot:s7122_g5.t1
MLPGPATCALTCLLSSEVVMLFLLGGIAAAAAAAAAAVARSDGFRLGIGLGRPGPPPLPPLMLEPGGSVAVAPGRRLRRSLDIAACRVHGADAGALHAEPLYTAALRLC